MKKRVVDLEADIISASSADLQQNVQQQRELQIVVEDLGKRIEELAEMVQNLAEKTNPSQSRTLSYLRNSLMLEIPLLWS